ncbi:bifunctional enoyl-CoA hydratase/phosphate acetyltransferase [Asticcacaulis machinosus]|uniref:Bifunctional enoyl-CoA hydratase/phosphate acetyltransferase n=1 Tax=Asticcacaulis machinosus TaxID=2984211 RepID=A0ABT5HMN1_9CAUL|nr:bifunctional enoyl-CoA hydratase/phosphate acetyltransferase [Asticcacaulis machinosus]MDC7677504.1 bifunctional enoyl-CoA hydratase/phosphate acetyltransferase [Asticcacaulis machinosus]
MSGLISNYDAILEKCRNLAPVKTAIVHPVKSNVIEAAADAVKEGLIVPVLIGPRKRITAAAAEVGADISGWELIDVEHSHEAGGKAAGLAASGKVDAIMKGALHTDELLGAIIRSDAGLRTERRISHAFMMEIGSYPKPFIITDAAINIDPDLTAKADIIQNAINLWQVLFDGDARPKVAILAAVETVNPKMQATLDAAALCKMADRGQITGAIIDGPLAFDNAINLAAAKEKGIVSQVAGAADILLVPDIESGNMLAKQLIFLGGADAAGIVLGARVPVILTSRADGLRARLLSCALAVLLSHARKAGRLK